MNLIAISKNVLINPSHVGCLEQAIERSKVVLYVWVDGHKYEYEMEDYCSIQEFIGKIEEALPNNPSFAG